MKRSVLRNAFLALGVCAFLCALFCGGSRLIVSPEQEIPLITAPVYVHASLICAPRDDLQGMCSINTEERRMQQRQTVICVRAESSACIPVTDANGNILSHESYMHAVYQSFALGDGFV